MDLKQKIEDATINIPTTESTDQQWMNWHGKLKAAFNKKHANTLFLQAWEQRKGDGFFLDGKANTVYLRNYLEGQGIKVEKGVLSYSADILDDGLNFFDGIFGTTSKIALGMALIIFAVIIYIVVRVFSRPKDYSDLISLVATRGIPLKGGVK